MQSTVQWVAAGSLETVVSQQSSDEGGKIP